MPATPFATLFDMDGVLVNNTDYHINAWIKFADNHGYQLSKEQYVANINGRVSADALAYLFQRTMQPDELELFTEAKEGTYRELYKPHLAPTPGLVEFLQALRAANVRTAVGTSAPVSNLGFTLDGLTIRFYFDAVVDASMVKHGKPNPEIYLTAAERVGVEPARCVVFEDAFAGIEAGLRAGMPVVALATTHTHDELATTGASLIIDDFTGLTVDTIRKLIEP
ncbi:HAD family hydrolase [Spirosoma sp. KUDC1026]|uniref:HAD family hydrolase n=1 Tax=Spirosoma sp. KUDC1026 TaxID=2745947 RepID=UPI00159BDA71|nr:HAD family phosphatase [Spirosoma sp. KUDC1026]QKZ14807.1 HAD family phosphatase [Spirosoma sp. KUDC1026]